MEKNNLQRISCCLGKYCCFLAEHAFLGFLILILISLIFSGFLFYKYSFLTSKVEPEITGVEALFKEELYQ
ncbi:MAG: hypothetical protein Q8O84_04125, partial [Nanoarchaeota archaeon]|nr:hypothetical protein [Nanoarchaeota archaeon]